MRKTGRVVGPAAYLSQYSTDHEQTKGYDTSLNTLTYHSQIAAKSRTVQNLKLCSIALSPAEVRNPGD